MGLAYKISLSIPTENIGSHKDSTAFPNSWELCVKTHKPIGDIVHPENSKMQTDTERDSQEIMFAERLRL